MRSLSIAIAFGVTGLSMLVGSSNAQAAVFGVPGFGTYDITTTQASDSGNPALLSSQPWYGSAIAAITFSQTVSYALGTPNSASVSVGPLFSYNTGAAYTNFSSTTLATSSIEYSPDTTYSFAVATPLPEPSEVVGTLALGFIGLAFKFKLPRLNLNKTK